MKKLPKWNFSICRVMSICGLRRQGSWGENFPLCSSSGNFYYSRGPVCASLHLGHCCGCARAIKLDAVSTWPYGAKDVFMTCTKVYLFFLIQEIFDYSHVPGQAILHHGRHRHGARATTDGNRINLVLWCRRYL